MAAATVNIPAIVLSGGPMLDGHGTDGRLLGSGTVVWQAREDIAAGKIDYKEFIDIVAASAPSVGHCNTLGHASTLNCLAQGAWHVVTGLRRHSGALSRASPARL